MAGSCAEGRGHFENGLRLGLTEFIHYESTQILAFYCKMFHYGVPC